MESILADYLSFSRPLQELRAEPLDPRAALEALSALLEPRARERGVLWSVNGSAPPLEADPRLLRQALLNLCANALDACAPGDHVALGVRRLGPAIAFEVRDTGEGMSAAGLEAWGTAFETTRASGTGLGVVITRGTAEQHGGRLEVESQLRVGTMARLVLPVVPGGEV